jgi:hypothetical protein
MKLNSGLLSLWGATLLIVTSLGAHAVGPKTPIPLRPGQAVSPNTLDAGDSAPDVRDAETKSRFGDYQSEAYKQSLMRTLQAQASLYGNLLPGGNAPDGVPRWRSLGPTNDKFIHNGVTLDVVDSGRVRTILQSPWDADTVYVLTSGGGLWVTRNFSDDRPDWRPLTDALQTTSGGSVAFGRSPNVLYLGLGDPFDGFPTLGGVVVTSLDGGRSWQPFVSLAGAFTVSDIKVDNSGASDIVLAATDAGIFRSGDGGRSFAPVASVPGQRAWSLVRTSAGWLASLAPYGTGSNLPGTLLYSVDHGQTWQPIPNAGNGFSGAGRTTLAVARPGESIVYALAGKVGGVGQKDLLKSVDGGLTWTPLGVTGKVPTNPNANQADMDVLKDQAWYGQMLLVDPQDRMRNTIYIGGELSTAKTVDGGNTWTLLSNWLPGGAAGTSTLPYVHADHHAAASVGLDDRKAIVFGTDGGIFVSSDGGKSFDSRKNRGIVSFLSQTVASSTQTPQSVVSGMQDTGTRARLRSTRTFNQVVGGDGEGVGWSQANNARTVMSAEYMLCFFNGLMPDTVIDYNSNANLCYGTDIFFVPVSTPTSTADPTGLLFFSAEFAGVWFTVDGGYNVNYLSYAGYNGLPANFLVRPVWHALGIDTSPAMNRFAIGGTGGRLAISLDGANSWAVAHLNGYGFTSYVTSPVWTAAGPLYVASESPISGTTRVLRSADNGQTFARADFGLPDTGVYQLLVDPLDATGNGLYAATYLGVYRTWDGGQHWVRWGAGLPAVRTTGLSISEDGKVLRAATYGRGIWELNLSGDSAGGDD